MSAYTGNPQFERPAEPISDPLDLVVEVAHYAEFLWGRNDPDLSKPLRWWFDEEVDLNCVTDGTRYFIPATDPAYGGYVHEVFVIKNVTGEVIDIAGITHPTTYRHLSPLPPGVSATTNTKDGFTQYFWG